MADPRIQFPHDWHDENMRLWRERINKFSDDDPRRFSSGFWTVAFSINPFQAENLIALNTALQKMPKFSGWPPFTYLYNDQSRPIPQGNYIMAYFNDFWRISLDGKGFMLRPMEEDQNDYMRGIYSSQSNKPFFDWTSPIYRMTEILKFIEALANNFSNETASFNLIVNYFKTQGRRLRRDGSQYSGLIEGSVCQNDSLEGSITDQVTRIGTNIEELILRLLAPIYEQFKFTELPSPLVEKVVENALNFRRAP